MKEELGMMDKKSLQMLKSNARFEITPCEGEFNLEDKSRFVKLELGTAQKIHMSALLSQMPAMISTGVMAQAYVVKFPDGLPHTLIALSQGGVGSMIRENGKFVGSASFYSMSAQAVAVGAFTAMSVATGQYFLSLIHREMKMMNLKLDEILAFLYGDKKAELMAEMSFVKYAYENYASIMFHEQQKIATITSLQEARKVAMKDIEFYIYDLETTISSKIKDYAELDAKIKNSCQIKECLEFSRQLYVLSSMMEVYFSENQDSEYLDFIERDIFTYIEKCDNRMLRSFGTLKGHLEAYKPKPMEKIDKSENENRVDEVIQSLDNLEKFSMPAVKSAMHMSAEKTEYYLDNDGNVYIKTV